jgi:alkylation response protein AidB-like acyl-CoA dehydrogenase
MYELSEPHKMIQKMLRDYAEKNILPKVQAMENDETLDMFAEARKMYQMLGAGNLARPGLEKLAKRRDEGAEEKGGSGLSKLMGDDGVGATAAGDPMIGMLMSKELCRVSPGFAMSFGVSLMLAGGAIIAKGSGRQIREYGIPIMTMEKIGAWCLTEPGAGSDAFGMMQTTATRDGNGGYLLNGNKTFITNGPVADIFVVYAKLDEGSPQEKRPVNTFILERGMEGFAIGEPFDKMGMRESRTSELFFNNVKLEKKHLVSEKETLGGREGAKESLGNERSGVPSMCWGIIERCYEEALKLAKELEIAGIPAARYQAVQQTVYEMYMRLKNVENIVFRMAWLQKNNKRDISFINASKAYTSLTAGEVAHMAMELFGEFGSSRKFAFEKMFRDVKLLELGAGTTVINMLTAARNELGLIGQ